MHGTGKMFSGAVRPATAESFRNATDSFDVVVVLADVEVIRTGDVGAYGNDRTGPAGEAAACGSVIRTSAAQRRCRRRYVTNSHNRTSSLGYRRGSAGLV